MCRWWLEVVVMEGACRHRALRYVQVRIEDYRGAGEEYIVAYMCELGEDRDREPVLVST